MKVNKEDIKVAWGKWKPFAKFFVAADASNGRFGFGYLFAKHQFSIDFWFFTVYLAIGFRREEMITIPGHDKPIPAELVRLREIQNKASGLGVSKYGGQSIKGNESVPGKQSGGATHQLNNSPT